MNFDVVVTDAPDAKSLALISDGLDHFNEEVTGVSDRKPLAVLAIDSENNTVLGGLTGRTSLGMLFIDVFFLPKTLRGHGLGSQLLSLAEEEGRRRGCKSAVLYTISFQAPDFYVKHGWKIFGEVPCDPPGTHRIFLSKDLTA
jgi:GNAT superfamily N-acetyltransferase